MNILIGYTGFVGSNLNDQHNFDHIFNSVNISEAFGSNPDLCLYAGIRAEKFKADRFPEDDLAHINEAIANIEKINPKRLVLISTVDVIPAMQANDVFEDTSYNESSLTPYGANRLYLERKVREGFPDCLIVRLPALFGNGLKKNFIYDIINLIPSMLNKAKFDELSAKSDILKKHYSVDENGFYRLSSTITVDERRMLKATFNELGFTALNFTDSRSLFSFYNLQYLWRHIEALLQSGVKLAHIATEPIAATDVYKALHNKEFINEVATKPFNYTFFKTRHTDALGGESGYVFKKEQILNEISKFVNVNTSLGGNNG